MVYPMLQLVLQIWNQFSDLVETVFLLPILHMALSITLYVGPCLTFRLLPTAPLSPSVLECTSHPVSLFWLTVFPCCTLFVDLIFFSMLDMLPNRISAINQIVGY